MSRAIHRLTAVKVNALKRPGFHADGGGLYLGIKPTGSKAWVYRYMIAGRRRDAGLGRYPAVGLAEAREEAGRFRAIVASGIGPIEKRNAEREAARAAAAKAVTFEECAEAYIEAHSPSWRNAKHHQQWRNTLSAYVFPDLRLVQPVHDDHVAMLELGPVR